MPALSSMSRRKKFLLFGCALPLGVLVVGVIVLALVVSGIVSREFEGEIVELFPPGALAYVEAPDLETQGEEVLAAWDAFESSQLFLRLSADPKLGEALRTAAGQIREARAQAPAVEAEAGVDLNADVVGRGAAAALYRAEGAAEGEAPGEFLLVTRVGRRLRMGALAAEWAPASSLENVSPGLELTAASGGWKITDPRLEIPLYAGLHRSALIISNSERLLAGALALGGAGLGGDHLGAAPRFADTVERAGAADEPLKLWVDLDQADAWLGWREKSALKSRDWTMSTLAEYVNAYQDVLFELPLVTAAGGWADVQPDGTLALRLAVRTDPSRRTTPVPARPDDAAPAAVRLVPQRAAIYSTVRVDFRTLWDRILATSNDEVRTILDENLAHYQLWLDELFPLLQGSITGVVGTRPAGAGSPLPPMGVVMGCNDPAQARRMVQRVADKYRERFAARYKDLPTVEIEETTIEGRTLISCRFPDPPKALKALRSPSFLFLDDALVMTTEREFAVAIARAAVSREPALAESDEFLAGLAGDPKRCRAAAHVDGAALGGFMRTYSRDLAEILLPLDWDAINAGLTARGLKPLTPEFEAAQRAAEQARLRRVGGTQENINRLAAHLSYLRSLSMRTTSAPDLPGYQLQAKVRLDFRR